MSPDATAGPPVPPSLFLGFAIASIGGPLALAAIYLPGAGDARSAGLLAVVGAALYALPLAVWLRYSEEIVSAGGLAAFVEAAVGRRAALVQAAVWSFSYFLYLPYTVSDVVYEMLGDVFPGIHPWRPVLQIALPVAIVGFVLLRVTTVLRVLLRLRCRAARDRADLRVRDARARRRARRRRSRTCRRQATSHAAARTWPCSSSAAACRSFSAPKWSAARARCAARSSSRARWSPATSCSPPSRWPRSIRASCTRTCRASRSRTHTRAGRSRSPSVSAAPSASTGLIVAEYLALSRLLYAVTRIPVRKLIVWIGVPFVAFDALSLLSPEKFDKNVLRPSLIALFLSQLIVFGVFPVYRARRGKLTALDVAIAVGAFALMAWGLYRAIAHPVST